MDYFILIAFIAVIVLIVYYYFKSSGTNTSTGAADKCRATNTNLPKSTTLSPPLVPEVMGLQPLDNLKEQIRSGIVTLFTQLDTNTAANSRIPLVYEDIEHDLIEQAKQTVESIQNFRSVHNRLQQILNNPAMNIISSLSSIIMADPVLSSKILKIVNSAYYGRTEKVNSIGHAVFLLGMVRLREILYREGMLDMLRANDPAKDALIEVFWRHATITSICASNLHRLFPGLDQGTLFTTGLIHDVGKIILVRMGYNPEYTVHSTIHDEDRIFGINHVVTGRIALEQWGFSDLMQSAIVRHHRPAFEPIESTGLSSPASQHLTVLFLANQLAKMVHPGDNYLSIDPLHPSYYRLVEQAKLSQAAIDNALLSQLSKSEAFIS